MNTRSVLYITPQFLQSRGVPVTQSLREWLARCASLAVTAKEQLKYEYWALGVIEEAAASSVGIEGKDWKRQTPVMPSKADPQRPALVDAPPVAPAAPPPAPPVAAASAPQPEAATRARLMAQCAERCPEKLRPALVQAFAILDADVSRGLRTYSQTTLVELLQFTHALFVRSAAAGAVAAPLAPSAAPPPPPPPPPPAATAVAQKRPRSPPAADGAPPGPQRSSKAFFAELLEGAAASRRRTNKVGQSTELERAYSRDEPTAADLRPRQVLERALAHIIVRAGSMPNGNKFLSDQLKGMRQDILVQDINDGFAVSVYERHARLCLELGDLSEFNQCQAALRTFYSKPFCAAASVTLSIEEFTAYRLVYLALSEQDNTLAIEIASLSKADATHGVEDGEEARDPTTMPPDVAFRQRLARLSSSHFVQTALQLCEAAQDGNSVAFLRAARGASVGMLRLVRMFLQRQRVRWLRAAFAAIRGPVPMSFVLRVTGALPDIDYGELLSRSVTQLHRLTKEVSAALADGTSVQTLSNVYDLLPAFFVDGSAELASGAASALFSVMRLQVPHGFSYERELQRQLHDVGRQLRMVTGDVLGKKSLKRAPPPELVLIDSAEVLRAVNDYISFLSTRADASRGQTEE